MSSVEAPEQAAAREAAQAVAAELGKGRTWQAVATELCRAGWQRDEAKTFVQQVEAEMRQYQEQAAAQPQAVPAAAPAPETRGGGVPSWVGYIGFLVLINFLSWVFDWPFWVY